MDAYSILGVSKKASRAEVDAAYKLLLEKYSSEKYENGPLAELAAKKREEINRAYDEIIKELAQQDRASQPGGGPREFSPEYAHIRQLINRGYLQEAEKRLAMIKDHDAEWHYLTGCVAIRTGNYNLAYSSFKTATNKDPMNLEYKNAFMSMQQQAGGYRQTEMGEMTDVSCCTCCNNLLCADCLCECMGGDLIPCC